MLTISNKALNYARTYNLSFVVNIFANLIECDWGACTPKTLVKSITVKALHENEVDKSCYNAYEYEGVKVFISKELKTKEDIHVYQKLKLPFMARSFGTKGIEV